jgi:hypothetical protein
MRINTMLGTPGTTLSDVNAACATAGRGTGMRWAARGLQARGANRVRATYVEIATSDAGVIDLAFAPIAADAPSLKQCRVPFSLGERSP